MFVTNIELPLLHFVGPTHCEWNTLRQTEGERFVDFLKRAFLRKNFDVGKPKKYLKQGESPIKNLLHVITYPHAIELFMFSKNRIAVDLTGCGKAYADMDHQMSK